MDYKFCPECGTRNDANTKFCTECGNKFPEETFASVPDSEPVHVRNAETYRTEEGTEQSSVPVYPEQAETAGPKKKKTGLVIALIILALIIAAGAVLFFTGNLDRMIATSKAGAGNYIGALESYEKYLSRSGDKSTEAYTQASLYALSAGDADKALMYARSVPEHSDEADSLAEKSAIVLARDAMAENDWQGAIECLKGISGDDAKKLTDEANYHLALSAAERDEFASAIALLEDNSFDLSEDLLAEYRYHYGVSLMNEGRYEEAVRQFEQTDFADSDDLRGECYFKTSVDYAFLTDLKDICYDIIEDEASLDSVKRAADKLGEYSEKQFNDSELAFFADELRNAFIGEYGAEELYNTVAYEEYQKGVYKYYSLESECLEIINEMYPFDTEDWKEIGDFFESPDRWNEYIAIIDQISKELSGIRKTVYESETQQYLELPNNTDHEVSITVWFYDYDDNYNLRNRDEVSAVLPAHEKTKLVFEVADTDGSWDYEFRIDDFN